MTSLKYIAMIWTRLVAGVFLIAVMAGLIKFAWSSPISFVILVLVIWTLVAVGIDTYDR